ncbi:MAG: preprotein translocase subunit SecE [Dehalococcoidales bacterium]|jgi:preprotein translocase subunit SecE|nr:preprotein translocase subunit SecE [Dehalococcoidales bacterium]
MAQKAQPVEKKGQRVKFFSSVIGELKKVTWLSKKEAMYLTGLVLLFSVIVGLILGGIDALFSFLVEKIFIGS